MVERYATADHHPSRLMAVCIRDCIAPAGNQETNDKINETRYCLEDVWRDVRAHYLVVECSYPCH